MLFFYTLDVYQLWVLPKRSHQAILKEIKPEYSLEGIFLPIFLLKEGMLKFWPPDVKSWLTRKDPGKTEKDSGKDWRQKEKGVAEDEMVRQYYQPNGHEFEQTLVVVEDRGAWHATVHAVTKSQTRLSNWKTATRTFPLEHLWCSSEIMLKWNNEITCSIA